MPKRVTLMELLNHPHAQSAVQQIAQGLDPRLVAAQLAGNALAGRVAAALGVPLDRVSGSYTTKRSAEADIIDAEYTVVDVAPGAKKKVKVG